MRHLVAFATVLLCGSASAATIQVTPANLGRAVGAARPGDVLQLKGDFGPFAPRTFPARVSVDASNATITNWRLANVSGLTWTGGTLKPQQVDTAKGPRWTSALAFTNPTDLTVSKVTVTGPAGGTVQGAGYGVVVTGGKNVKVQDGTYTGLAHGILIGGVDGFEVQRNTLEAMSVDAINVAQDWHGLIAWNVISGSDPLSGAHPDCIQSWSRPDKPPTSDIVVENNSCTGNTQGIFFGNHHRTYRAGYKLANGDVLSADTKLDDSGFDRITVRHNYVCVAAPYGIGLASVRTLTVAYNHVCTQQGAKYRASLHVIDSTNVTRTGNVVEAGAGKGSDSDVGAKKTLAGLEAMASRAPDRGRPGRMDRR